MTNWKNKVKFINSRQIVGSDGDEHSLYGPELVNDGVFNVPAAWNLGVGWSVAGGILNAINVANGTWTWQNCSFVVGRTYRTEFTILNYVSGQVKLYIGSGGAGSPRFANGTYLQHIVCALNNQVQIYSSAAGGNYQVDNLSVRLIY